MYTYTSNSFIVTNKNAVVLEPMTFFKIRCKYGDSKNKKYVITEPIYML